MTLAEASVIILVFVIEWLLLYDLKVSLEEEAHELAVLLDEIGSHVLDPNYCDSQNANYHAKSNEHWVEENTQEQKDSVFVAPKLRTHHARPTQGPSNDASSEEAGPNCKAQCEGHWKKYQ